MKRRLVKIIWLTIIIIAILLFSRLDDIIELSKNKSPQYQRGLKERHKEKERENIEKINQLKDLIGENCKINSDDLIYLSSLNSSEIKAKIINMDDEWVEMEPIRKRKVGNIFLKIENIINISKLL